MLANSEIIIQERREVKEGKKNAQDTFLYKKMISLNPLQIEKLNLLSKEEVLSELLPEVPEIKDLDVATFSRSCCCQCLTDNLFAMKNCFCIFV
jgi:hypothetical protein